MAGSGTDGNNVNSNYHYLHCTWQMTRNVIALYCRLKNYNQWSTMHIHLAFEDSSHSNSYSVMIQLYYAGL